MQASGISRQGPSKSRRSSALNDDEEAIGGAGTPGGSADRGWRPEAEGAQGVGVASGRLLMLSSAN